MDFIALKFGCFLKCKAKRSLKIVGVNQINETSYSVMFDRIEAGTYLIAAAITQGDYTIKKIIPNNIKT